MWDGDKTQGYRLLSQAGRDVPDSGAMSIVRIWARTFGHNQVSRVPERGKLLKGLADFLNKKIRRNKNSMNFFQKTLSFLKRKDGTGYVEDKQDLRDLNFGELIPEYPSISAWQKLLESLPNDFRLPYDKKWLYNQGSTSACVFHSAVGILNFIYKFKLSPRYLSKFGFQISNLGWGAYMRDGVKAIDKFGSVLYDEVPNDSKNITSDKEYRSLISSVALESEALERTKWLYVRIDNRYGQEGDFDCARLFLFQEQMPCVVGVSWYSGWANTPDEGKIEMARGSQWWGHAMLCIGWDGDYFILVDSAARIVKLHKRNVTFDIWGVLGKDSIERYHIELRRPRDNRNSDLEQVAARKIKDIVDNNFASHDPARALSTRFWFTLIDAYVYEGYTLTDLANWLTHYKRANTSLFDLTKPRYLTLS